MKSAIALFAPIVLGLGAMHQESMLSYLDSPTPAGLFKVYELGSFVSEADLVPLGIDPEDLNVTILEGDPNMKARFDMASPTELGFVLQTDPSSYSAPALLNTEHSTVTRHGFTLTGTDGIPHVLMPGDSYIALKGTAGTAEFGNAGNQRSIFAIMGL